MHKTFTKELIQSLKVITLGLALGVGINYAFAVDWTPPTANPPQNNAAAPINVSGSAQTKLNSEKQIKFLSSSENTALTLSNTSSASGARALAIASGGMFSIGNVDLWGNLNVGIAGLNTPGIASNFYVPVNVQPTSSTLPPFGINLSGNAAGPNRENAISLVTNNTTSSKIGIIQNVPDFFFWNYNGAGENANIIAKIGKFTRGVFTSNNPALYSELGGTPGNQNLAYGLGVDGRAFILGDSHDQDAFLKISDNASGTPVTSLSVDPQGQGKVNMHVNGIVTTNNIKIVDATTTPGSNRILTSDADGDGTWKSFGQTMNGFMSSNNHIAVVRRLKTESGNNDTIVKCPASFGQWMAISGGVDCEDRSENELAISQPWNASYGDYDRAYAGNGDGNGAVTYGSFPTGWHGACTGPNSGDADITVTVVCLKLVD